MTAVLNVQSADPTPPGLSILDAAVFSLNAAFDEWIKHFDYTAGVFNINISFRAPTQPLDVSLNDQDFTVVRPGSGSNVLAPSFGLSFAARAADPTAFPTPVLYVNPNNFNGFAFNSNIVAPIERELGHALGILALVNNLGVGLHYHQQTVYDGSVRLGQGTGRTTFNGPNAQAAYGGPVPVLDSDPGTTTVGGGAAVDTTIQGASTVKPLDVALLRDAGVPALSDQELLEHQIARLYFGAFGRVADGAGLVLQYSAFHSTYGAISYIAAALASSAELTARYGTLSDAAFVRTVYQNALGRQPDAALVAFYLTGFSERGPFVSSRGSILLAITDTDEARGRLSANANITYSGTAEAQVARLYDTAFGRDADPTGFAGFVPMLINGKSLQQVALSFLGSGEFASRYGTAASDTTLVDALYANALHRPSDAAGEAFYVRALGSGGLSRAALLVAFSESQEHINLVAQRAGARDAAGFNLDLSPHLGIIPVISAAVAA